jgi:hypothetical protein
MPPAATAAASLRGRLAAGCRATPASRTLVALGGALRRAVGQEFVERRRVRRPRSAHGADRVGQRLRGALVEEGDGPRRRLGVLTHHRQVGRDHGPARGEPCGQRPRRRGVLERADAEVGLREPVLELGARQVPGDRHAGGDAELLRPCAQLVDEVLGPVCGCAEEAHADVLLERRERVEEQPVALARVDPALDGDLIAGAPLVRRRQPARLDEVRHRSGTSGAGQPGQPVALVDTVDHHLAGEQQVERLGEPLGVRPAAGRRRGVDVMEHGHRAVSSQHVQQRALGEPHRAVRPQVAAVGRDHDVGAIQAARGAPRSCQCGPP